MILKLAKRALLGSKNIKEKSKAAEKSDERSSTTLNASTAKPKRAPQWEQVLTESLKENALAPSDEVILHAFDLYCDELNAPFEARRHAMNGHLSNIIAGFAKVQALAPGMVERAAAKHKLELHRFIDQKDEL